MVNIALGSTRFGRNFFCSTFLQRRVCSPTSSNTLVYSSKFSESFYLFKKQVFVAILGQNISAPLLRNHVERVGNNRFQSKDNLMFVETSGSDSMGTSDLQELICIIKDTWK